MRTGLRMTTQTRDKRQINVEFVLNPFDSRTRLVGQHLGEFGDELRTSALGRVLVENLGRVGDLQLHLRACTSTVDTAGRLGRVACGG